MARSVADAFRRDLQRRTMGMSLQQRLALAMQLGNDDLELFVQASGLTRGEAIERLAAAKAAGRRFSKVMERSR